MSYGANNELLFDVNEGTASAVHRSDLNSALNRPPGLDSEKDLKWQLGTSISESAPLQFSDPYLVGSGHHLALFCSEFPIAPVILPLGTHQASWCLSPEPCTEKLGVPVLKAPAGPDLLGVLQPRLPDQAPIDRCAQNGCSGETILLTFSPGLRVPQQEFGSFPTSRIYST